jgi:hypothetical protein
MKTKQWLQHKFVTDSIDRDIEDYLTGLYGSPPIVHTYNGESAEEFGIPDGEYVLVWSGHSWCYERYRNLNQGDRWMLQPPPPK